jgi:hypothetical protein
MEPAPFALQNVLNLSGGYLDSRAQIRLQFDDVSDMKFVTLRKNDNSLALAMGMSGKQNAPFHGCSLFDYMVKLRNTKVDSLIKNALRSADPMADTVEDVKIDMPTRSYKFHEAKIEQVIEIELHEFTSEEGKKIPATRIKCISTPKKNVAIAIEASPTNFNWFLHASKHIWYVTDPLPVSPCKRAFEDDMKEIVGTMSGRIKYQVQDDDSIKLYVNYRRSDGRWTKKARLLRRSFHEDRECMKISMQQAAAHLGSQYDALHYPGDAAEDEGSAEDEDECTP